MDQVAQVREKIDIAQLITSYVPLKRAGRNFKALCPFHSEKTPSFVVSPERQIWHCFGCGKGGDCFTFLMEYENLEFPEALRILAKQAGVEFRQYRFETGISAKKEKMYISNKHALQFYHYVLTKHNAGRHALDYLVRKRKLTLSLIEAFQIGFAPGVGNALASYLMSKKQYKREDLIDAGLVVERGGKLSDFFVGRIVFPLIDHRDNVIGFSGRVIEEKQMMPGSKYINTRDTLVYQKANHLFGINSARDALKKTGRAIIVEGEFDVISCFTHGIKSAVAAKGTVLTQNQVRLLSRFVQKVSLCFDQDTAGQEAIKRSLSVLEEKGLTTTVILQSGKDADESLRNDPISFKKAVRNEVGVYDFLIGKYLSSFDKRTAEGKKRIGEEILPILSSIGNEIVKEHYLKKVSNELDTSYESIATEVERIERKQAKTIVASVKQRVKRVREEILEEYLLALIIQHDDPKILFTQMQMTPSLFAIASYQKILAHLRTYFAKTATLSSSEFLRMLPKELTAAFDACYLLPKPDFKTDKRYREEMEKVIRELTLLRLRSQIRSVGEKIKETERLGRSDDLRILQKEFRTLLSRFQNAS